MEKVTAGIGRRRIEGEEMERESRKVIRKVEKELGKIRKKRSGWWDNECKAKKREVRRKLREWRRGKEDGKEYRKKKRV